MEGQEYYRMIFDESADAIVLADASSGEILDLNPAMERLCGWKKSELVGKHQKVLHPDESGEFTCSFEKHRSGDAGEVLESKVLTRSGEIRHVAVHAAVLHISGRKTLLGFFRDISEKKRIDGKLVESGQQLRLYARIFEQSGQGIVIAGKDGTIVEINPAVTRMTGFSREELIGQKPDLFASGLYDRDFYREMWGQIERSGFWQGELSERRKDGSLFSTWTSISAIRDEEGSVANYIAIFGDLSENRAFEERVNQLAYFDSLTGLPNRMLLSDRTDSAIRAAEREKSSLALLMLDLDRFRNINDTLGHPFGDRLLRETAARFRNALREEDTVSRLGGDEFHILLPGCDAEAAAGVARKLLDCFSTPFKIDAHELDITASIGIALFPEDGQNFEMLFRSAETAMYRAKEEGRNRSEFYNTGMSAQFVERIALENGLRRAIDRVELLLHYQPRVNLQTGRIVGAEALVRWNHPELGLVSPEKFVRIAEETGLVIPLGRWVLCTACKEAAAWMGMGHDITVSVNVSARQLMEKDFVEEVQGMLEVSGLDAKCLELEIVETVLLQHHERIFSTMHALKKLGIRISIDDFGTGYSSLSYLKRFPIDAVKIDQSFIADIVTDPDDEAIVNAIVSMAHDLKLDVVAEGVETEEQRAFLSRRRCDEIQGFHFSHPVIGSEMREMLASGKHIQPVRPENSPALLLLDDEENILHSLVRLLRRDGYRILKTTSAKEALAFMAREEVGVIVSDQRMPEMDGVSFLRRAKRLHPDSIRLVLSGYTDLNSVTDAINEGAVYKFLTKPWDDGHLRETIREAFLSYGIRRERDSLLEELKNANEELSRSRDALQHLVEDRTLEALRTMDVLKASQNVLECLPIGVVGVDESGLIVLANRKAREEFGEAAGKWMGDCLPDPVVACVREALQGNLCEQGKLEDKGCFRCYPLDPSLGGKGVMVIFRTKDSDDC
ncbi:MAG: EAL domain-containing protein [Burkholderiales bacterium]|nr:EAL domain-containing protein [Burkholderiales bacterium]